MLNILFQRHRLLWQLIIVLAPAVIVTMASSFWLLSELRSEAQRLGEEAREVLAGYARDAEQAWLQGGEQGVAQWLAMIRQQEIGDIEVVDHRDQSLSGQPLSHSARAGLRFQRSLNSRISFRFGNRMPHIGIPFSTAKDSARLIIQLPPRYRPGGYWPYLERVLLVVIPALVATLLGLLLFWRVRVTLHTLQDQVLRFKDDADARVTAPLSERQDEFGELARSFNHMADQVSAMLSTQRQLLNDMSHELRTPLSRLAVALEGPLDAPALRERVAGELAVMRRLVDDSLALGWQDAGLDAQYLETLSVAALWDLVADNACFESGWDRDRFVYRVADDAQVTGNLNVLAQALENLVRNAVRYSPPEGTVTLAGRRTANSWHLTLTDQGCGVPDDRLESIFAPFVRLDEARGKTGFGLGLSIARRAVNRLGGEMWAENARPGLRIHLVLPAAQAN